jgi:hypothetical protein
MAEQKEQTEREKLEHEKITLAKKLGIWDEDNPVDNFRESKEYARIQEINAKLTFLVKD